MSLDIWFSQDVSQRLDSLDVVAEEVTPGEFQRGFKLALEAVRASFFGIPNVTVIPVDTWSVTKKAPAEMQCDMRFDIHPLAT